MQNKLSKSPISIIFTLALVTSLFCLGACAGGGHKAKLYQEPDEPFKAIAVFPAKIRYARDSIVEDIHRTTDILDTLWRHSTWLTIAPTQFRVVDEAEKSAMHGTDIVRTLKKLKLSSNNVAYLRTTLSAREKTASARVRTKLGVKVGQEVDVKIVASVELFAMDGTLLAESEAITKHDPFGSYPDYDQRPAARQANEQALKGLIDSCNDCFTEAYRGEFPIVSSPTTIMHSQTLSNDTFVNELKKVDPLEKDFRVLVAMQYYRPELTLSESQNLKKSSAGFCLASEAEAPFTPHDCITHINNKPISSVHQLSQAKVIAAPLKLKAITPKGKTRTVVLP